MSTCPGCQAEVDSFARVCPYCGRNLVLKSSGQDAGAEEMDSDADWKCPSCHAELEPGDAKCPYCGFDLTAQSSLQSAVRRTSPSDSQELSGPPDSHLTGAILSTICCCVPFGIVAIVKAAQSNGMSAARDYVGAKRLADDANKWITYAVAGGVVAGLIRVLIGALIHSSMH